jgi:hypothetical protein
MKRPGPLLTLLAGLLLGLLTLTLDATAGTRAVSSSYQKSYQKSYQDKPPSPTPAGNTASPAVAVPALGPYAFTARATATVRGAKADGGWIVLAGIRP